MQNTESGTVITICIGYMQTERSLFRTNGNLVDVFLRVLM